MFRCRRNPIVGWDSSRLVVGRATRCFLGYGSGCVKARELHAPSLRSWEEKTACPRREAAAAAWLLGMVVARRKHEYREKKRCTAKTSRAVQCCVQRMPAQENETSWGARASVWKVQCSVENEAGGRVYQNNANVNLAPPTTTNSHWPSSPLPKSVLRRQPASARDGFEGHIISSAVRVEKSRFILGAENNGIHPPSVLSGRYQNSNAEVS